jgi:hypothetical protein
VQRVLRALLPTLVQETRGQGSKRLLAVSDEIPNAMRSREQRRSAVASAIRVSL